MRVHDTEMDLNFLDALLCETVSFFAIASPKGILDA
jgi:hypothetical protein